MMRYIIRLVLPVAVLTVITGMLPVLPTDIGGYSSQLAQIYSGPGTIEGDSAGRSFSDQRIQERQETIGTGFDINPTPSVAPDPFYYQVIVPRTPTPVVPVTTPTPTSPTVSSPTTGVSEPVVSPTPAPSASVSPSTSLNQGQASQIIQQQFQQQSTPVIEVQTIGGFLTSYNSPGLPTDAEIKESCLTIKTASDCIECCKTGYELKIKACTNGNLKDPVEINSCIKNNTALQNQCETACSKRGTGSAAGTSGTQTSASNESIQVWIKNDTNLVTITPTKQTGGEVEAQTSVVLLPGTANVSLTEKVGYVPVQVAPVTVQASRAVEISRVEKSVLQVEDAGDLLDSIAVANDILGRQEVKTVNGKFVVPGVKSTALGALGSGALQVLQNVNNFFIGLLDGGSGGDLGDIGVNQGGLRDPIINPPGGGGRDTCTLKLTCADECTLDGKAGTCVESLKTVTMTTPDGGKTTYELGAVPPGTTGNWTQIEVEKTTCACVVTPDWEKPVPTKGPVCKTTPKEHAKSTEGSGSASAEITITREKGVGECINAKTTCTDTTVKARSGDYSYSVSSCETKCENEQKSPESKRDFEDRAYAVLRAKEQELLNEACASAQAEAVNKAKEIETECDAACPNDGVTTNCQACGIKGEIQAGECSSLESGDTNGVTFSDNVKSATIQISMSAKAEGSLKWQARCGLTGGISVKASAAGGIPGGGTPGGGAGSGSKGIDFQVPEIDPTMPHGIQAVPTYIGQFVRENIFGAFFSIGGDRAAIVQDESYEPSTTAGPLSPTGKSCINLAGTDANPRLPDSLRSSERGKAKIVSGYTCGDSRCADGTACKAFRNESTGGIGCGCLPSQQGSVRSPSVGSAPAVERPEPKPSIADSCAQNNPQCANVACTLTYPDKTIITGTCGQISDGTKFVCGCDASKSTTPPAAPITPTPPVTEPTKPAEPPSPEQPPVVIDEVLKCGSPRLKSGDTTVFSIADLEKQVTDQIPLAAEGKLGEDTPADIIKLYTKKLECLDTGNICKASACIPFIGIVDGKAVASCGCSGDDNDNSSPQPVPTIPAPTASDPETPVVPEPKVVAPSAPAPKLWTKEDLCKLPSWFRKLFDIVCPGDEIPVTSVPPVVSSPNEAPVEEPKKPETASPEQPAPNNEPVSPAACGGRPNAGQCGGTCVGEGEKCVVIIDSTNPRWTGDLTCSCQKLSNSVPTTLPEPKACPAAATGGEDVLKRFNAIQLDPKGQHSDDPPADIQKMIADGSITCGTPQPSVCGARKCAPILKVDKPGMCNVSGDCTGTTYKIPCGCETAVAPSGSTSGPTVVLPTPAPKPKPQPPPENNLPIQCTYRNQIRIIIYSNPPRCGPCRQLEASLPNVLRKLRESGVNVENPIVKKPGGDAEDGKGISEIPTVLLQRIRIGSPKPQCPDERKMIFRVNNWMNLEAEIRELNKRQ